MSLSSQQIDLLNERYGVPSAIQVVAGVNQLPKVVLQLYEAKVEVYLHGAHVTSFQTSNGQEVLYMSDKAAINSGSKIRGGIPICFPQFGPGDLVQHGFARQSDEWKISRTTANENAVTVVLTLCDTHELRKMWNQNEFRCDYTIELTAKDQLLLDLKVSNLNMSGSFGFTTALHTYFAIDDITRTAVQGLSGLDYTDKVKLAEGKQEKQLIEFSQEIDQVYYDVPVDPVSKSSNISVLLDKNKSDQSSKINVELLHDIQGGFRDCVVWNPWIEKARELSDMPDEDYKQFVCVEAATIRLPIQLPASHTWNATMILSAK
jgi:glucose-6-phosphate 1-epimerase